MEKKISRIRSVRISKELNDFLEEDAEEEGLTFNALANKVLMKYVQWDKFREKFGFVTMTSETFENILNNCSNESLETAGRHLGEIMMSQITMFLQKDISFQGFLQTFALYSKYSGLYKFETKREGSLMVLTFHHDRGVKWSIFLRSFVESSLSGFLDKAGARVKYTGNLVFAHVRLPT